MEEVKQQELSSKQKAENLRERFLNILTKKGEISVGMIEGGLDRGVIKMTRREKEAFDNFKQTPVLYGVESYLKERFSLDKIGAQNLDAQAGLERQAEVAAEHGWHMTGITKYTFGYNSLMGYEIQNYGTLSMRTYFGEAHTKPIQNVLVNNQTPVTIDALTSCYENGQISSEVDAMNDVQLWQFATSGGFSEVEKTWAQGQQAVIAQSDQMLEDLYVKLDMQ